MNLVVPMVTPPLVRVILIIRVYQDHFRLVDKDQNDPPQGPVFCQAEYIFTPRTVAISLRCNSEATTYLNNIRIVVPVIASSMETIQPAGDNKVHIHKEKALLSIHADQPLTRLPTTGDRLFNFVPGLEAVPFVIRQPAGTIALRVQDYV